MKIIMKFSMLHTTVSSVGCFMHKNILWINVTAEIHTSADVRNPPSITELSVHMIGGVVHPIRNKHNRLLVATESPIHCL